MVAGWRFTPPPRVLAAAAVKPLASISTPRRDVSGAGFAGQSGRRQFCAAIVERRGQPLPAKEATLTLSLPERGIEPFERKAVLGADGSWSVRDVPIPVAGRWHLRIDALVTDFEKITLGGRVRRACALKFDFRDSFHKAAFAP